MLKINLVLFNQSFIDLVPFRRGDNCGCSYVPLVGGSSTVVDFWKYTLYFFFRDLRSFFDMCDMRISP